MKKIEKISIKDKLKYTTKFRNPHRLKKLILGSVYPLYNLFYWGVKSGFLWEDTEEYVYKNEIVSKRIQIEIWKIIKEDWEIEYALDISHCSKSIPKYIIDTFFTPSQLEEICKITKFNKEDEEIWNKINKEEDNLEKVLKLVPKQIFQQRLLLLATTNTFSALGNELRVLLSESHRVLGPFPMVVSEGSGVNYAINSLAISLGIGYYSWENLRKILNISTKSIYLEQMLKLQTKSVRRKQAQAFCNFIFNLHIDDILTKRNDENWRRSIFALIKYTKPVYYLKHGLLGNVCKVGEIRRKVISTLKVIDDSCKKDFLVTKSERTVKSLLKLKWIPEERLLKTLKNHPLDTINNLPKILLQLQKSKREESYHDFILALYELPRIIKENGKMRDEEIITSLWNLKYAIEVYPGLRDIEPYIKSEILDAISVCVFNFTDNTESAKKRNWINGLYRISHPELYSQLRTINRFLGKDFAMTRFKEDINIASLGVSVVGLKSTLTTIYESFGDNPKKGSVYISDGLLTESYTIGKNPNEEWIAGWSPFLPCGIEFSRNEGHINICIHESTSIKNKFFDDLRGSKPAIDEDDYFFLLFLYHPRTKTFLHGFNLGNTSFDWDYRNNSVKLWKVSSFLRYMEPLLSHPSIDI